MRMAVRSFSRRTAASRSRSEPSKESSKAAALRSKISDKGRESLGTPSRVRVLPAEKIMREQWYGDNRDLVKWAVLVRLARENKAKAIVQVLMLRPNEVKWRKATADFPAEVLTHFRRLQNIHSLGCSTQLDIQVWYEPFRERKEYFAQVVRRVQEFGKSKLIVLLDPDTGLERSGRPRPKHIAADELTML